jgi:hypothetical protein
MKLRLSVMGLMLTPLAVLGLSGQAQALPNCNACVPAYRACVASGKTDCDSRYATCLAWCPEAVTSAKATALLPPKPLAPISPAPDLVGKSLLASVDR